MEVSEETPECCVVKHSELQQMLLEPQVMKNEIHNSEHCYCHYYQHCYYYSPLSPTVDSSLISAVNSKFGVVDFKGVRNADVSDLDK